MDETTARDEKLLLIDLLRSLLGAGAVAPEDIDLDTIVDWFPYRVERAPEELVEILAVDPNSPVEYTVPENSRVWVTKQEAAWDYLNQLEETPWYELNVDTRGSLMP